MSKKDRKKRILSIEDEPILQKIFTDMITKEGYEVISALDGEAGLQLARTKNPDLILLDLVLPKKHGFEVLRILKNDQKMKDIPIIVLTNLGEIQDIDRALNLGATTYLVKANYSLEEVIKKIKEELENGS